MFETVVEIQTSTAMETKAGKTTARPAKKSARYRRKKGVELIARQLAFR
jgi:hypothetical protein